MKSASGPLTSTVTSCPLDGPAMLIENCPLWPEIIGSTLSCSFSCIGNDSSALISGGTLDSRLRPVALSTSASDTRQDSQFLHAVWLSMSIVLPPGTLYVFGSAVSAGTSSLAMITAMTCVSFVTSARPWPSSSTTMTFHRYCGTLTPLTFSGFGKTLPWVSEVGSGTAGVLPMPPA